jgi:hypothetical protein
MEPVVRYDLRGDDVPIMLTARHNLPASPLDQRRLDLAHALATMTLCDVEEGGDLTFRLALHETPLDTVTDELRHICSPVGLRQLGRPNCGPRWLFPAEAPAGEGLPPAR